MGILGTVSNAFFDAGLMGWDIFLTLGNVVRFSRPVGKVTPEGHPGYGGVWPEYRPPQEGDSRCSCPALNAMANHGTFACATRFADLFPLFFLKKKNPPRHHFAQWTRHQIHRSHVPDSSNLQL